MSALGNAMSRMSRGFRLVFARIPLQLRERLVLPCLLFTLMLGPVGLLLSGILRMVRRGEVSLVEAA